ncbi:ABC transporter substrate-binding protein [Methanomicrobium antiquum]|uniref:ABC transporter substrate-binding protein n=1 Tax=Methanomicrobium antiquum TaxID=487686 RepID=A0AAF0FSX1_9EURY|nr:ABC transporter substrate-binding protein [Methanomicrobium antiquum]WFN37326.1 ABC transporter substrate-binding protein [Methanomicrobium antiquum]
MFKKYKIKSIYIVLAVLILAVIFTAGIAAFADNTEESHSNVKIPEENPDAKDLFTDKAYPEYAKGYSVEYHNTYKVVTIKDPWDRTAKDLKYILVQKGEEIPQGYDNYKVVSIPVESVITLSTTQLPHIKELGEISSIKGHNGINLIFDEDFQKRFQNGSLAEIGSGALSMESQLKIEQMIELEPEIVFCSASNTDEYDNRGKLEEAGLRPAIVSDWMENTPLGRAEWIKFFAYFYNKEETANEVFEIIKNNYTHISNITRDISDKPTVFAGIDYQGTWYAPGGESYVAKLFRDAGGDYIITKGPETGSISLDFESIYEKAYDADFWLNTGSGNSIEDILAMDSRYSKFKALKSGNVYNYNARVNDFGGNDYWQSAILNPDVILADLVEILHPGLLDRHNLYYYKNLADNNSGGFK